MPSARPHPCTKPGCHDLVTGQARCAKHRNRDTYRGNAQERGYDWRWQQYRAWFLKRYALCGDRPLETRQVDSQCRKAGILTPATVVDHIVRHKGQNDPMFWADSNHQSLCVACHNAKTARERT